MYLMRIAIRDNEIQRIYPGATPKVRFYFIEMNPATVSADSLRKIVFGRSFRGMRNLDTTEKGGFFRKNRVKKRILKRLLVPEGLQDHFRVDCTDMVNNTFGEFVDGHFRR